MSVTWEPGPPSGDGSGPLVECVHASRLLGVDPSLVLHGGGNTSAKDGATIHVKASGHDLATITPDGFAPLERAALDRLLERPSMTDGQMVAGLRAALLNPGSATPSIETLLHNLLPGKFVLHTHADAIVTLTNTRGGETLLAETMGAGVLRLPYCMPGFDLARLVRRVWAEHDSGAVRGIVLAHHGLFTFADHAQEAYDTHIGLVDAAQRLIAERTSVTFGDESDTIRTDESNDSALRAFGDELRTATGSSVQLHAVRSAQIERFLARPDLAQVSQQGPSTLEHVIRTHRTPLLGRDVAGYLRRYTEYFERNRARSTRPLRMLDPTPRVILDDNLGLVTTGNTPTQARIAEDIYRHTIRIITAAQALGGYMSISPEQAFDIEYWELEQAKLR